MLTIACAYRTGGDYTTEYVDRLFDNVRSHLASPHLFYCATDVAAWREDVTTLTSPHLWPGWWSKLILFTLPGPVIFLDLDTIVVGDLEPLAEAVLKDEGCGGNHLWMLEGFRWQRGIRDNGRWASGIMAWSGDWRWLVADFHYPDDAIEHRLDQRYIQSELDKAEIVPYRVQDHIKVASYRHSCQEGVPAFTDVVCFHGHPRPHEIGWMI